MLELLHALHAALPLQPREHETEDVNAPARRGVVHRVLVDHALIAVHDRCDGQLMPGETAVNDRNRQARRGHVFLRAGEDHAVF